MNEIPPYFRKVCENLAVDGMCKYKNSHDLSTAATADLVAELERREGIIKMIIPPENTAYTRVWHSVTRVDTSHGIVTDQSRFIIGPAKIIVVRGDEQP